MGEEEKSDNSYSIRIPDYVATLPLQEAIDECDEDSCDGCYRIKNLARERGLTELVITGRHLQEI